MSKNTTQNALCKSLGPEYRIRNIDLERCIYRDFGNGFDIEIKDTHTTDETAPARVYLWYDESIIAKKVSNVKREDLGPTVEELYQLSHKLLEEYGDSVATKICELKMAGKL